MEVEEIAAYVNRITPPRLLRFVSEEGEKCCEECLKYHDLIFEEDDKDIPQIPIHPNCRCHYEYVTDEEIKKVTNKIEDTSKQINNWAKKILAQGDRFLLEFNQAMLGAKNAEDFLKSKTLALKMSAIIAALEYTIFAAEKIKLSEEILKSESRKLHIEIMHSSEEIKSLATAIPDYISALKRIHYLRLKDFDQQPRNLPSSPQEAIMRGFTKAKPNENWYHRGKGQIDNEKYYHKITGQEVVFDKNGEIVTDPENIGTKNYGSEPKSWDHVIYDVIPYYIWGNSPDDTTPLLRRIFGYH